MKRKSSNKLPVLAIATLSIFVLGGCFNFGGSSPVSGTKTVDERSKLYDTNDFSAVIPKDWEIISKAEFTAGVPEETEVVFRNNVKNEDFTANVNIVKNNLQEPISTVEYAKRVGNRQNTGLYNYKESKNDPIKISIGDKEVDSFYRLFEAQKGPDEKLVRYMQIYGVKGDSAYIITGAVSPKENDAVIKTIEDIVKSFKLK
jgi:hypothetical protein